MNKTLNVFVITNIILSLPLWVGYLISSYQNEFFLFLIAIWYINAFVLFIKHRLISKLIIVISYVYLFASFLGIFSYLDHNQYWPAFFNIMTFIGGIVLFIQYQYIVTLIGFTKSESYNGSNTTKNA